MPVTGLPDLGTSPRFSLRGQCYPHQASNRPVSVSWDNHGCEKYFAGYLPHPYAHGWRASAVWVPILVPVKII